jgi:hypothetical protein
LLIQNGFHNQRPVLAIFIAIPDYTLAIDATIFMAPKGIPVFELQRLI